MRTVTGPVRRVVVVGAGLSGLAAALHLRGAGLDVTVLEQADHPGGRVGYYEIPVAPGAAETFRIDNGATVLTMPNLIDEALAAVGASRESTGLTIRKLAPAYHARFADGSTIDVHTDPDAMVAEVTRACGADEAARYLELRAWLQRVFEAEYDAFLDANFDSPLDMLRTPRALAQLTAAGGFGRLGRKVGRILGDERLQRLFTFQALYAGVPPAQAMAVYGAIPYMDTCLGVYFPDGGMREVARALADAFVAAGGQLEYGTRVTRVDGRTVTTQNGEFTCDATVVTADLGSLDGLLGTRYRRRLRASPAAVVAHGTIARDVVANWPAPAHHTIDFGAAWAQTFREITRDRLMSDPSLLVTRPAVSDATQLLGDREPLSVLAPCPNLASAPLDWPRLGPAYLAEVLGVLETRGYKGISQGFAVARVDTPATWQAQGMLAGTPFSAAHLFRQTGPFRRRNLPGTPANVVLAGCGTTPGVGIPPVLLSGKHAAQRILG